jgi:uncharacterized protein (DUF488 family)
MMLFTIGYQSFTVEEVEAIMADKAIRLLIDVRSVPYSRNPTKYGFNRNRLEIRLATRYLWKGDILGGKFGPATQEGIDWLLREIPLGPPLLMCLEANPSDCHRFYDITARLSEHGVSAVHLCKIGGTLTEKRTAEVLAQNASTTEALW